MQNKLQTFSIRMTALTLSRTLKLSLVSVVLLNYSKFILNVFYMFMIVIILYARAFYGNFENRETNLFVCILCLCMLVRPTN